MVSAIESQTRKELLELEQVVAAMVSAVQVGPNLPPEDMTNFVVITQYISGHLEKQFAQFHDTVSRRVLPNVADLTSHRVV